MKNQYTAYYLPAEWAEQSGIQLTWPHKNTDWEPYLTEITQTFIQLAREISKQEKLVIAAQYPDDVKRILQENLSQESLDNVRIYACPNNDTWARDHAPLTLMPIKGTSQQANEPLLLDFKFNGWGEKFDWENDNRISKSLFEQQAFNGTIESFENFVLEGGSIESDGEGTIMTTSFCLLAPNRNQPMNQTDIEKLLMQNVWCGYITEAFLAMIQMGILIPLLGYALMTLSFIRGAMMSKMSNSLTLNYWKKSFNS